MDTAYHLEALRRQRLLDRALEAKERLREKVNLIMPTAFYHCSIKNLFLYCDVKLGSSGE